jgi:hypothetical protein
LEIIEDRYCEVDYSAVVSARDAAEDATQDAAWYVSQDAYYAARCARDAAKAALVMQP